MLQHKLTSVKIANLSKIDALHPRIVNNPVTELSENQDKNGQKHQNINSILNSLTCSQKQHILYQIAK